MSPPPDDSALVVAKVVRGARWAAAFRLLAQLINWSCTIVVVRYISATDYGLNAMLQTPLEMLFLLSTFGLDLALVQAKKLDDRQLRCAFGYLLLLNGGLFLIYFFGAGVIAAYFNEPRLKPLAEVLAFIYLAVPFRVIPNALLERELKFKLKASVDLFVSVATALTTLTLAVMGAGVWALVTGVLVSSVLAIVVLSIFNPWFIRPDFRFSEVRKMMAFGGTMTIATAVAVVSNTLPVTIAGPVLGSELLGIFAVALEFAVLPLSKTMPIVNSIVFPTFSRFQDQPESVAYYLLRSLGFASLLLVPALVGVSCVAHEFVPTVLGEKWLPAVAPLTLLALAMPFRLVSLFLRQVMAGAGRPDLTLRSSIINLLLFLPLVWIGTHYELMGVVGAYLVVEPVIAIATMAMCGKMLDLPLLRLARALVPAAVCSLVMAVALAGLRLVLPEMPGLAKLLVEIGLGGAVYAAALRLVFPAEMASALRMVRK